MSHPTLEETAAALAASEQHDPDRLRPAVAAAEQYVRARTPAGLAEAAVGDLRYALVQAGVAALGGGDPQQIEDALLAARPDSPLTEETLRHAWLVLVDDLARSGEAPPFGGSGGKESWAFTARSRPARFVDVEGQVARVADLFGQGTRVVVVRGPGASSFLAAVRRVLLARHGADALVPPVLPAARDDVAGVLRPYVERAPLEEGLRKALDKLRYGEDLIGVMGRAGDQAPVALLLDDAHLHTRSLLLGAPILLEPSEKRRVLLAVAGPADPADDGPLTEVLADARERELLVEVSLPGLDEAWAGRLLTAAFGEAPAGWAGLLAGVVPAGARAADRLRAAQAWIDAVSDGAGRPASDGEARLRAGFDAAAYLPLHPRASRILAWAALEGDTFHALAVGKVAGRDEDFVEDLLHDDELEIDGQTVGTCDAAVPPGRTIWADLPDGLHPVFRFGDARLVEALRATLEPDERKRVAAGLRDTLLQGYGPASAWQVADRVWRLDVEAGRDRQVQQLLLGGAPLDRIEAGFRRMLPVLGSERPYRLALARLYGAAMEAGGMATATGRIQLADQGFQGAAAAAQRLGRPGQAGEALARLGEVRLALALPQPATQALDVAEQLLTAAKHDRSLARVLLLRAEVKVLEGDLQGAIALLREGIKRLETLKDPGHAALGLIRLGRVLYEAGEVEQGILALDEAIRRGDGGGDPRPAAAARMARAFVHAEQEQLDPAFALLQQAAQAFQAARMPVHIVEVAAAGLQRRHGNPAEAEQRLRKVAEAFKQAGAAIQWADAWHEVGRCLLDQDQFTEAGTVLLEALDIRKRARDRFSMVRVHEDLAQALEGQGDKARALAEYVHARRLAERTGMARRLGGLDAVIARLRPALDQVADADAEAIIERANAAVDEIEAVWAAPPQVAQKPSDTVH